jgi:hypothetical protein
MQNTIFLFSNEKDGVFSSHCVGPSGALPGMITTSGSLGRSTSIRVAIMVPVSGSENIQSVWDEQAMIICHHDCCSRRVLSENKQFVSWYAQLRHFLLDIWQHCFCFSETFCERRRELKNTYHRHHISTAGRFRNTLNFSCQNISIAGKASVEHERQQVASAECSSLFSKTRHSCRPHQEVVSGYYTEKGSTRTTHSIEHSTMFKNTIARAVVHQLPNQMQSLLLETPTW